MRSALAGQGGGGDPDRGALGQNRDHPERLEPVADVVGQFGKRDQSRHTAALSQTRHATAISRHATISTMNSSPMYGASRRCSANTGRWARAPITAAITSAHRARYRSGAQ